MQQRSTLTHWICSLIGLFSIGLLLREPVSLPAPAYSHESGNWTSVIKSAQASDQSDCSPTLYTHLQKALVSRTQTSFPLPLPTACLASGLAFSVRLADEQIAHLILPASFYFLRLLFEHQISINAP